MATAELDVWSDYLERTLACYEAGLLREVATHLLKPRNQWPVEELRERVVATLSNAVVLDRRLKEVDPVARRLLGLLRLSGQSRWAVGHLLQVHASLSDATDLQPIFQLFENGLLFPDLLPREEWLKEKLPKLRAFEQWLGQAGEAQLVVFCPPQILSRLSEEDLALPSCPCPTKAVGTEHEADGLECLLRVAVLWQVIHQGPLRRTGGGEFFKRDLDRLRSDTLLNATPGEQPIELADLALLTVFLGQELGVVQHSPPDLTVGPLPSEWDEGLYPALARYWSSLLNLTAWNPLDGWTAGQSAGHPYPSAYLLLMMLLASLPADSWAIPNALEEWLWEHHPFWKQENLRPSQRRRWVSVFLLGVAAPLRLIQTARDEEGQNVVRLSSLGRSMLGLSEPPVASALYPQTLLVQPNLEILVYRQGLTPSLIARLTQFAEWKSLGSACTMQLSAESVYRGLEAGQTLESMLQLLQQHGMRPVPPAVVESLRTWSNKRERITVFPATTLFEFNTPEDLNEAIARGLPGVRVGDRLLAFSGDDLRPHLSHFRTSGQRDYAAPPEKCVDVAEDGITLSVDLIRSDLLLETELLRFAEPLEAAALGGRRRYRLTPESLAQARRSGQTLFDLREWFRNRTGMDLPAAARLLLLGPEIPALTVKRRLVVYVQDEETADGLLQWPQTRGLIDERLGPMALVVLEDQLADFRERLRTLGMQITESP